ncbi:Mia40p Ecym_7022 [Eremothecium cymbalariae DBVPG|uniref:Mitochondrial intermembrane space import and assembly protein 40 n=1 Tax=Eremothecium cymbalariae (strain CBS 270.75 / DBVPG 7215 / KCTC 17166 / NRRL Y-17582) TaxID=931890 RepID=G8JVL4_ERECY|nr:hypothetical protein Ecym_7022 [Eremothecium cymbalariae DBVPG\
MYRQSSLNVFKNVLRRTILSQRQQFFRYSSNSSKANPLFKDVNIPAMILASSVTLGAIYMVCPLKMKVKKDKVRSSGAAVIASSSVGQDTLVGGDDVEEPLEEATEVTGEQLIEPSDHFANGSDENGVTEHVADAAETVVENGNVSVQESAYDPGTGEINWDCPCLGGMAHGPCGEEFKAAFSCFVYSEADPKGIDCVEKFQAMQTCFRQYPEHYAEQLKNDEEEIAEEQLNETHSGQGLAATDGDFSVGTTLQSSTESSDANGQ